jgi:hypothetical protein
LSVDDDLALAALADIRMFLPSVHDHFGYEIGIMLRSPIRKVETKLQAHKNFMIVLTAICSKSSKPNDSALRLLGPGREIYLNGLQSFWMSLSEKSCNCFGVLARIWTSLLPLIRAIVVFLFL